MWGEFPGVRRGGCRDAGATVSSTCPGWPRSQPISWGEVGPLEGQVQEELGSLYQGTQQRPEEGASGRSGACLLHPYLSHSGSRRSPLGRRTGRPRHHSHTGLRAGRGWSGRHPPLENTQRVGQSRKGVSGGGRRGQREEGKGDRGEMPGGGGGCWGNPPQPQSSLPGVLPPPGGGCLAGPGAQPFPSAEWPRVYAC